MAGQRDRVRVEADQRVDLGDWRALQENARTALKMGLRALLFGPSGSVPTGRDLDKAVQYEFDVTTSGTEITITKGRAWAGEVLEDGTTYESGIVAGEDGDATQVLDLTGEPSSDYWVWVRQSFDPGIPGSRVFWDAGSNAEVPQSIDTREVAGWKAVYTASSTPPDDRYVQVGIVSWNGSSFTAQRRSMDHVFEGTLDDGNEVTDAWGDGANDRDADRAAYGVSSLVSAFDAVRRQFKDIIGVSRWYSAVPQTTRGTPANASLSHYRDHYDATTDPHGDMTLTGTTTIDSGGTLDGNGTLDWDGAANIANLTIGTSLTLPTVEGEWTMAGPGAAGYCYAVSSSWTILQATDGGTLPRIRYGGTGTQSVNLPVQLPKGATLDTFGIVGQSESGGAGASASLNAKLMRSRYVLITWVCTELADLSASGSDGTSIVDTDTTLSSTVLDLDAYWVDMTIDNDGTANSIGFALAYVEYEATTVLI